MANPLIFTYKVIDNLPLHLELYPPSHSKTCENTAGVPVVVYFHGGGLTVGNCRSWFPSWLQRRLSTAGIAFISASHRLCVPSTGHDVLQDIKDTVVFIAQKLNESLDAEISSRGVVPFRINPSAIAVSGTSAGGLCAYLAAIHACPKPVAILSMYGMGGQFLSDHWLKPKTKPFFRGREILDPAVYEDYLFPKCNTLRPIADSPLSYHPQDSPTPGYPANPRMVLTRLLLQLGTFFDYYTGDEGLSQALHSDRSRELIPSKHLALFPQFWVTRDWPPSFLVHGTEDTAVPIQESINLRELLDDAGVEVILKPVEGKEHSFDYAPDAEAVHGELFDEAVEFLVRRLLEVSEMKNSADHDSTA